MKHVDHAGCRILALAIATAFFIACSTSDTPSESDARKALEKIINEDSQGLIKLVSFKKTNAQSGETLGVKLYSLECEGEIEFLEGGWWWRALGKGFALATTVRRTEGGALDIFHSTEYSSENRVEKGQHKRFHGVVRFQLTENGWRAEEGRPHLNWTE